MSEFTNINMMRSAPGPEKPGGCFTCQHYGGPFGWCAVKCLRDGMVRAIPENGCCSWTREPGTDDEAYWERRES